MKTLRKPWYCYLGLHGHWIDIGKKNVVRPLKGPFDPRNDAERTFAVDFKVCAACGREREYEIDYGY